MKRELLISCLFAFGASYAINAQSYCRPTECISNGGWGKAPTQMTNMVTIVKTTDANKPDTLLVYERPPFKDNANANESSFYYLQNEKQFEVSKGDNIAVTVYSGIWTADQALYLDFDGDGVFEKEMRAFGESGKNMEENNSSWNKEKYGTTWADANYRKQIEKEKGADKVLSHTFTFKVPEDAKSGKTIIRIKSDGDGSGWHAFDACSSVGWAGSIHDFGMNISMTKPQTPPTIIASTDAKTNDVLKVRLFKTGGGKAIVSWGDKYIQEVNMDPDTKGDTNKNATNFKGIEITHTSSVDNPQIEIWSDDVEGLYLSNTKVSNVDLSKLTTLKKLVLDKNPNLTTVNVSTLKKLQKLDLSNNPALTSVQFGDNMDDMVSIDIYHSGITSLDVSMMPNLSYLSCEQNPSLKSLKISKENNKSLSKVFVYGNGYNACEIDDIYLSLPDFKNNNNGEHILAVIENGNEANKNDVEHSNTKIAKDKNWKVIDWRNGKKEIEGDGSECKKNEVNELLKASIKVTPNPTSSNINIEIPSNLSSIVRIYSTNGEKVFEDIVNGKLKIDVSSWNKGSYIVNVLDNSFKIIVR